MCPAVDHSIFELEKTSKVISPTPDPVQACLPKISWHVVTQPYDCEVPWGPKNILVLFVGKEDEVWRGKVVHPHAAGGEKTGILASDPESVALSIVFHSLLD